MGRCAAPEIETVSLLIETDVTCPWCGETFATTVDTSEGDYTAIEDCTVCCRPIQLAVNCEPGEVIEVQAERG